MQVNVSFFLDVRTLALALLFTVCAIIGKLVAGIAAGRNTDRLAVGIGMVPRGEVGLVFSGSWPWPRRSQRLAVRCPAGRRVRNHGDHTATTQVGVSRSSSVA